MFIRLGYDIIYEAPGRVPLIALLYTHPSRAATLRTPDNLQAEPESPITRFTDMFGNTVGRLVAPAGDLRLTNDLIVEDTGLPDEVNWDARQHPVEYLPAECLPFLSGSRYCPVQELGDIAWRQFGQSPLGWGRVQAVCDWVHERVRFDYQTARSTKTALDVYHEREGVCRDFMHLAITLCRCLNIPARYATGYLGDIGVPVDVNPMDFSAWFEAYLGGHWYTFDARHNTTRIGRVLMARGRDAVDVALTTSFGPTELKKFVVWTEVVATPELSPRE